MLLLTGVSGVGKDFVLDRALRDLPSDVARRVRVDRIGDAMLRVARRHLRDESLERDALRLQPLSVMSQLARIAVADLRDNPPTVCISHLVVPHEAFLLCSPENERILRPTSYCVVTAAPTVIGARRRIDFTRSRVEESLETIRVHQELTATLAAFYAREWHARIAVIDNSGAATCFDSLVTLLIDEVTK